MKEKTFYIILSVVTLFYYRFVVSFVLEIRRLVLATLNVKFSMKKMYVRIIGKFKTKCLRNVHSVGLCKTGGDRDMNFNDELFTGRKGDF